MRTIEFVLRGWIMKHKDILEMLNEQADAIHNEFNNLMKNNEKLDEVKLAKIERLQMLFQKTAGTQLSYKKSLEEK